MRARCAQGTSSQGLGRHGGVLVHQLELPGKAHGGHQGLRVLHLNLKAERRQEPAREELDPLGLVEVTGARKKCLPPIQVIGHRPSAAASRQLEQRRRASRGPLPQVEEFLETRPCRGSLVLLDLHIPELGAVLMIVRGHPHTLLVHDPLLSEE